MQWVEDHALIVLIRVFQAIGMLDQYAWTVTGLSAIVLFVESFMEMTRFREKCLMYRNTCNSCCEFRDKMRCIYISIRKSYKAVKIDLK